ncbi:DUF2255 family protein [Weissella confusa]|nr:DUF2255 family protein [Weissella confusa]
MMTLTTTQQETFAQADDFHIAPYRADGTTPGTLTWIWSVVVDGDLYVRAWNGQQSRWYNAAKKQGAGKIMIDGNEYTVTFELVPVAGHEALQDEIDAAYRKKYAGSQYMPPMIADGPRNATVRVILK